MNPKLTSMSNNSKLSIGCLFGMQFLPITLLESIRSSFILHFIEITDVEPNSSHTDFDLILMEASLFQALERFNKKELWNNISIPLFLLLRENDTISVKLLTHPIVNKTIIIQEDETNLCNIIQKTYQHVKNGYELKETEILISNKKVETKMSKFLADVNKVIETNSEINCISIENIADQLLMSAIALRKKIKKITGMTAVQYILHHRLQMARNFLEKEGCNVQEAAVKTGFLSNSYFSKTFKSTFGISPSNYLKT